MKPKRRINSVPMPYSQLVSQFIRSSLVQLRELGPPPAPLPQGYNMNARCEFHLGALRNTIENPRALKHKVQDLIDSKVITFTPNGPNILNNPMPPQAGTSTMP